MRYNELYLKGRDNLTGGNEMASGTINIKVGRHTYEIGSGDEFMDNGSCVQLVTQSKERSDWGHTPNPILSKRVIKEISVYDRIQKPHHYNSGVQVFSLDL